MKNKLAQRMGFTLALAIGAVSASTGILAQNQGMTGDMMMGSGHMMGGQGSMMGSPTMGGQMMQGPMMSGGCPMMGGAGMGQPMMGMMQGPMMGGMGMMQGPMMGMMGGSGPEYSAALGLTDKQQQDVRKAYEQMWSNQWDLMQQMQKQQASLRELYVNANPDTQAILKAHREMSDLRLKMLENQLNAQQQSRQTLTEEQRQKLQQMQQWMMGGW